MKMISQITLGLAGLIAISFFVWVGFKMSSPQTFPDPLMVWEVGYAMIGGFALLFLMGLGGLLKAKQKTPLIETVADSDVDPGALEEAAHESTGHDDEPVQQRELAVVGERPLPDTGSEFEVTEAAPASAPEGATAAASQGDVDTFSTSLADVERAPEASSLLREVPDDEPAVAAESSRAEPSQNDVPDEGEAEFTAPTVLENASASQESADLSESSEAAAEEVAPAVAHTAPKEESVEAKGQDKPRRSAFPGPQPSNTSELQKSQLALQKKLASLQKKLVTSQGDKMVGFGSLKGSKNPAFDVPTRRVGVEEVEAVRSFQEVQTSRESPLASRKPQNVTRPVPGFARSEIKAVEPDVAPLTLHGQPREPFSSPVGDISPTALNVLWQEYVEANHKCGRATARLKPETFFAHLKQNYKAIIKQFNCDSVRFGIKVKAGKVSLQAVPIKRRAK